MEATLDTLEAGSTHWYRYVVDQTRLIIRGDPYGPGSCGGNVLASDRRVTVDTDCMTYQPQPIANRILVASLLAHEACHVYHHDHDIVYPEGPLREEWECGKPGMATRKALDPNERYFTNAEQMPFQELVEWTKKRQQS